MAHSQHTQPSSNTTDTESLTGMKATQVIKIIPEYHGRLNENIHEFLDATEECFGLVRDSEKKILLSFIRTKLKGAAFKAIQYLTLDSWDQLKDHLQRRFGVGDTIRYIEKEFTMLTQNSHETVAEFGERTCTLAAKISEYNIKEKGYDSEMFQKIMEDRILVQFVTGLREPVRFQVKTYKCEDYREALTVACNLEKEAKSNREFDGRNYLRKLGLKDQGTYHEKPRCFNCNKMGHKAAECYLNKQKHHSPAKINIVTCYFCNKPGHIAKECRTRANVLRNKSVTNNHQTFPHPHQGNESRLPQESRTGRPANSFKSAQ